MDALKYQLLLALRGQYILPGVISSTEFQFYPARKGIDAEERLLLQ
jgi:hypothetical protein